MQVSKLSLSLKTETKNKTMENNKFEIIQNEILELTNKINSIQNSLNDLKTQESKKSNFDFDTFMELADNYFIEKVNLWDITSHLQNSLSAEDYCDITLSLRYGNEIEIETGWKETEDIVTCVMDRVKMDFKEWMQSEIENLDEKAETEEENEGA